MGKSSLWELGVDDCDEDCIEYLCFVYALGSALYKNFNKNVFNCGQLLVALVINVPARFHVRC